LSAISGEYKDALSTIVIDIERATQVQGTPANRISSMRRFTAARDCQRPCASLAYDCGEQTLRARILITARMQG
jgi:hypothetical protein